VARFERKPMTDQLVHAGGEARAPDWSAVRARFPGVRREAAFLNTASFGLPPDCVLAEVAAATRAWGDGTGSWRAWEARAEGSRALFARVIGARAENVAFLNSLSAAAAQVAESLPAPRDGGRGTVVVGAEEFRSNLFPWWGLERRGFRVRRVPFRDGRLPPEELLAAIDEDTALVAVSHVQSANGFRTDVKRLGEACRTRGARLFVDGTQSVGANALPLEHVDYLGTAAYKWLLSPRGAAFLYVADEHLGRLAPLQPSWKTPDEPYVDYYGGPFPAGSRRAAALDVSLPWLLWQGTTPALEFLLELGLDAVVARDQALAQRFRDGLRSMGLPPTFGERESSQIVSLAVPNAKRVEAALAREGVSAAVRAGYLRTSFHLYNDEEDVDRALFALRAAL